MQKLIRHESYGYSLRPLLLKMSNPTVSARTPVPAAATPPLAPLVESKEAYFQLRLTRDLKNGAHDTILTASRAGPHVKVVQKDPIETWTDSTLLTEHTPLSAYVRTLFHSLFADQVPSYKSVQVFAPCFPTILISLKKLVDDAESRDVIYDIADITERGWFALEDKC